MSANTGTDMDAKYSPLNHGGLEAVERQDGMEVVPQAEFRVDRKSTLFNPEPAEPQYQTKEEHGNYYGASETHSSAAQTPYSDFSKPAYFNSGYQGAVIQTEEVPEQRDGRKYCGMRKAIFIAVVAAVLLLICVAAVLGGVLGVMLPKKHMKNAAEALTDGDGDNSTGVPLQTMSKTGIASAMSADGSGRMLLYYQDKNGNIIENSYLDDRWMLEDHAKVAGSFVTREADAGSPLAAVAYESDGKMYRRLFYITSRSEIQTIYSTTTSLDVATAWSEPKTIIDDPAQGGSPALTACTGPGLNGIHVYYGSQSDYINEVRYHFDDQMWESGGLIDWADTNSGVACSVFNSPEDGLQIVNVYYRDKATKRLRQSFTEFDNTDFTDGPKAPLNQTIAAGSDIAVCTDDTANEYVFFQDAAGTITKSNIGPDKTSFGNFKAVKGAVVGSKLAAAFLDSDPSSSGPALTFQNATSGTTMWLTQISRSDAELVDTAVT